MFPLVRQCFVFSMFICAVKAFAINSTKSTEETVANVSESKPRTIDVSDQDILAHYLLNRGSDTVNGNTLVDYDEEDYHLGNTTYDYSNSQSDTVLGDVLPRVNKTKSCAMCKIREEKRKSRIDSIKNRLSHALKIDELGTPNMTRNKLPKVPSFLRLQEKFENRHMLSDSPSEYSDDFYYEEEKEEYGEPERTYVIATNVPDDKPSRFENTIYFNSPLTAEKEPNRAYLWLYIPKHLIIGRNRTEIFIYLVEPAGKSGGPIRKKQIIYKKKHHMKAAGWHHYNVMSEVERWKNRDDRNLGLVVEALDSEGRNMISLPDEAGRNDGYEPMLDIRTSLKKSKRRKRSTSLFCDDHEETACCRYPLTVDFIEFGWDFVIAPKTYDAYYCAGECQGEAMDETLNAHLMRQGTPPPNAPESTVFNSVGPCCTPTHMSDLSMLYFDHENKVLLTKLPRMKADRCGCA